MKNITTATKGAMDAYRSCLEGDNPRHQVCHICTKRGRLFGVGVAGRSVEFMVDECRRGQGSHALMLDKSFALSPRRPAAAPMDCAFAAISHNMKMKTAI
ncbi:hypothetical protein [Comamonas sp. JUb58]|uniref:hypothetical protein n=1 Tax=Comamonas sp. JUb58 TaxID=2485114 RepID=UPI001FB91B0E|nr:hypothetical protein [Comamonas sp. JUb58]